MGLTDFFKKKKKGLVGIDIGSSSVKVVTLIHNGSSYKVDALGKERLPEDTIVDGAIISKLPLADSIERICSQKKIKENRVATSISGHSVIVKKVTLPALTDAELQESIQWEAEQYIPFDLTEVNVDYEVVRRVPSEEKLEVILVAAKKEKISDYTSVISMAGKMAHVVDIDAFALQNVYELNYKPEGEMVAALLNIGASSMTINILKGTEFLFTRDITTGGVQYNEFLQQEFGITLEEAEQYKMGANVPREREEKVESVLRSVSENLALEIEKTFDYFRTTTYSQDIEQLYICGGASLTPGLLDYFSENFRFPVEFLNPFKKIKIDRSLASGEENFGVDFAVAVGLALRTT